MYFKQEILIRIFDSMKRKTLIFILTSFIWHFSFSGLIQLNGVYNGENLFVENAFDSDSTKHCVTNVYVNDVHLLDHPVESIVELNLSIFDLNEDLNIRIYHLTECQPEIVNPKAIEKRLGNHFAFMSISINEERIKWETHGEADICKFTVQQKVNDEWVDYKYIKGNGTLSENFYNTSADHKSGENYYRIKYRATGGETIYSEVVTFTSDLSPVYFYPKRVEDFITFETDDNREVDFTITTMNGKVVADGSGLVIDCRELEQGVYYILKYDNKEGRFYMKENSGSKDE